VFTSTPNLLAVNFDGSASSDADGNITGYSWDYGDGSPADTSSATPPHTYAVAGTYTVTLTVTDNNGATASDTATVTIANRPPTANAGPDQTGSAGGAVTLNGSGSTDPDGVISNYSWNFGDGASFNAGSAASTSHTYAAAGTYTVTLTVTDNNGASANDTAVITVTNSAPSGGAFKWASRYGGSGSIVGYATAVDSAGNVIVAGAFWGTVNAGGNTLTSAGSADIVVAKYSPTGAHLWSKRFGSTFDDIANGVAVDSADNVIVAGSYTGTVNFGGSNLTAPGTAKSDVFVVKFSPAGDHLWSKGFGGGGDDGAHGVAVDAGGNVVVTGCFNGAAAFDSVVLTSAFNSTDAFLAKLTPAGVLSWAKSFGGSGIDCGNGVGIDAAGNITLVGSFMGPADFGGGSGSLSGFGISDVVLARYSPAGVHLWSKQFGGGGDDAGYAVAVDANGNAAVTGYVQGTVDFGGGNTASLGAIDTFIAKYNSSGAHLWSHRLGSTNAEQGFGVAMDSSGNVFLAGTFQGSVDFGTGVLNSVGSWDILAAKYSPSGVALWSKAFGDTGDDYAYAVATDSSGNSIFTGMFHGTVDFGGGDLTSTGWIDMFVMKFGP
jgi:PKD repeat protein